MARRPDALNAELSATTSMEARKTQIRYLLPSTGAALHNHGRTIGPGGEEEAYPSCPLG
jgi:hypothetical protein